MWKMAKVERLYSVEIKVIKNLEQSETYRQVGIKVTDSEYRQAGLLGVINVKVTSGGSTFLLRAPLTRGLRIVANTSSLVYFLGGVTMTLLATITNRVLRSNRTVPKVRFNK